MSDIIYTNPAARSWISTRQTPAGISETLDKFHNSLPGFQRTRLVSLDAIAKELGIKNVFVKDETLRMGLPAFKILGASWAINRAIVKACNLPSDIGLEELGAAARAKSMKLFTATEGNHGRAVAKTARILGLEAMIFVPDHMVQPTRDFIASEGARVMVVEGSYDVAVSIAALEAEKFGGTLIQDTAYESYEEVPEWIVDGYTTMLREIDEQLDIQSSKLFVVPIGVGSLGEAVVTYSKAAGRSNTVLAVEPETAACLWSSLQVGENTTIETGATIMAGMHCETVSTTAWPFLKAGVDVSVTVSDVEAHEAVLYLQSKGVSAGPCGAATLAGLRYVARVAPEVLHLTPDAVVVLICSEGAREYEVPSKTAK